MYIIQLIQSKCGGDLALVDVLVRSLMGRLVDSCMLVRMLCVKGLGNIADTGTEMVSVRIAQPLLKY